MKLGNVIETHERAGEVQRVVSGYTSKTKSRHAAKRDG
jgi:hypothetical protein